MSRGLLAFAGGQFVAAGRALGMPAFTPPEADAIFEEIRQRFIET